MQVCLHFGRKLLRGRNQWSMNEFMQSWQGSVPEVCLLPQLFLKFGQSYCHNAAMLVCMQR